MRLDPPDAAALTSQGFLFEDPVTAPGAPVLNVEVSRLTDDSDLDAEDADASDVEKVVPDTTNSMSDVNSCELTAPAEVGRHPRSKRPRHNRSPSRLTSKQACPVPLGEAASENMLLFYVLIIFAIVFLCGKRILVGASLVC